RPHSARAAARLTAVVVFPTPPFWLMIAILRIPARPPWSPVRPRRPAIITPPGNRGTPTTLHRRPSQRPQLFVERQRSNLRSSGRRRVTLGRAQTREAGMSWERLRSTLLRGGVPFDLFEPV